MRLERVGVFPFSPEEGTPAAVMTDRCEAGRGPAPRRSHSRAAGRHHGRL
ncbi:MAG: hypothetical protein ACLSHG_09945 [Oscillospiraceae bacterium]